MSLLNSMYWYDLLRQRETAKHTRLASFRNLTVASEVHGRNDGAQKHCQPSTHWNENHMKKSFVKQCKWVLCAAALVGVSAFSTAQAGNLEPAGINLGFTSFLDGFGPTKPDFTYQGYLNYSQYNHIENNAGNQVPNFVNPKIDATVFLNQLIYTTNVTFFNGKAHLSWDALVPLVHFNTSTGAGSTPMLSANNGIGDLTFGPFIQFDPVIRGGRPVFSQRFELDFIAPTGHYSTSALINPSSNFWSINPYWAVTVLPTPKTEISWRLHYLYNFSNNNPGLPQTRSDKAGQAGWVNFTASYAVKPNLNIGINGYYFKQFTNDAYSSSIPNIGQLTGDTGKAMVFAIGPGAAWKPDAKNFWFLDLYDQVEAKNRTRGIQLNLRWLHAF